MAEDDTENINNIIESNNEKQDVRGKEDGSVVVSKNEGSQKSNTSKLREELEAKVKEKKSAVDKAQNALSKAKANLEKAVSESQRDIFGKAEAESKLFAPDLKALNKVISEKEGILALAKESLQKSNDELNSWTPENQTKISFNNAISTLENLKINTKGKLNAFGIAPAIWNAGLDTIILAIKGGVALADAVQQGIQYWKDNNVEFDEAKVTAHLEEKVGLKRTKQQPNEKDNKEEPMLEEPRDGGDEGKKGSEGPKLRADQEGERKIRRHFKTIVNNESLKEATKFMLENDFAYNVKSMDKSLSRAKAYLEKNGIEDSYTNFITYGEKIEGLTGDEAIALAFLIQTMINSSMIKEAENGNQELADALNDDFYRMSEKIAEIGTEAGRIVNAFNLFILDMSNPISAQMALNRISKKAENEAKASDSKERKKA